LSRRQRAIPSAFLDKYVKRTGAKIKVESLNFQISWKKNSKFKIKNSKTEKGNQLLFLTFDFLLLNLISSRIILY